MVRPIRYVERMQGKSSRGLAIAGSGLALATYAAQEAGVNIPSWLLILFGVVAGVMFFGGIAVAVKEYRGARSEASVFTRAGKGSQISSSGNFSSAETFVDAGADSIVKASNNWHEPHA